MGENFDSVGINYLAVCDDALGEDAADARQVARGIRAVIAGEVEELMFDYPCHSPDGPHWFYMRAIRMSYEGPVRVIVSHEDITDLKLTEEALKKSEEALTRAEAKPGRGQHRPQGPSEAARGGPDRAREESAVQCERPGLSLCRQVETGRLKPQEKTLVEIVDTHLNDIISPFLQRMSALNILLTPQEIQVAALVKDGKSSKEIADILHVSETTVHFHRKNLREKLGLKNRRANLRAFLLSKS